MNIFDFCIVCVSLIGFIVDLSIKDVDPGLLSVISVVKAGRVVRIFRLAMRIKGIRKLLETLIYTIPSLMNVFALLCIVLFIFTVLGMSFFGDQPYNQPPFELYNEHANFRYFHIGFLTLFRMSTGESWNGIMHDSMEQVSYYAWIYYVAYYILGTNLLFQLIVAVVLEQFSAAAAEEEAVVTPDDIEEYATTWSQMDPKGTHYISFGQVPLFLKSLEPPLGIGNEANTIEVMQFMKETELSAYKGRAHYVETFFQLVMFAYKRKFKNRWKGTLDEDILLDMTSRLTKGFPSIEEVNHDDSDTALQNFAALKIQSITRKRQAHKRMIREGKVPPVDQLGDSVESLSEIVSAAVSIPPSPREPDSSPTENGGATGETGGNVPGSVLPPLPAPKPDVGGLDSPRSGPPGPPMVAGPPGLPSVAPSVGGDNRGILPQVKLGGKKRPPAEVLSPTRRVSESEDPPSEALPQ